MNMHSSRFIYLVFGFLFVYSSLSFKPIDSKNKNASFEQSKDFEPDFFGKKSITDGPYIFYKNDKILVKWISYDQLTTKIIRRNKFNIINRKFGFEFNPNWIKQNDNDSINYTQDYSNVENLIAVSDVHGQYDLLIKLLRAHNVIDKHFNWIFNTGHLVVLGDVFDRGPQVNEILWLIYRLEQQAKEKGGKVHVMLGNHEVMVFNNDLRYVHKKYTRSAELMQTTVTELYSENSFLGNWLRKKPIIVKINDMLFVHAGISPEFISKGFSQHQTNKLFAEEIIGKSGYEILSDPSLAFLRGRSGPLWYRGYFDPQLPELEINSLLKYFDVNHIIVGHTSMPNIVSPYNKKVIGIDSSIKLGDSGEILVFKNNEFYRGTPNGALIKL